MIRAIALDDEPPALKIIESFSRQVEGLSLEKTFTRPAEALKYLGNFPTDLVFLDVEMPGMTGIDFFKSLPYPAQVILTTAYGSYAVEGFNLQVVDFLLKPFSFDRFCQAVDRVRERLNPATLAESTREQGFFIRADYSLVKIQFADIVYVEGLDDYLRIFLVNHKPVVARMTLKNLLEKLPSSEFVRIHRSFIIPLSRVETLKNHAVVLGGKELAIGKSFEEEFMKKFRAYGLSRT